MSNLTDNMEADDVVSVDNSYWVGLKEALQVVEKKKAFDVLINEGYLNSYVKELLAELIDPYTISQGMRGKVVEKLVAVAKFQDYMDTIMAMGSSNEEADNKMNELEVEYKLKVNGLIDSFNELAVDSNFKKVMLDGYLQEYAVKQTSLLAVDRIDRTELLEALVGISHFQQYLLQVQRDYAELQFQDEEGE